MAHVSCCAGSWSRDEMWVRGRTAHVPARQRVCRASTSSCSCPGTNKRTTIHVRRMCEARNVFVEKGEVEEGRKTCLTGPRVSKKLQSCKRVRYQTCVNMGFSSALREYGKTEHGREIGYRIMVKQKNTHRYIQLLVSRLGLPVSHSGANVIQPNVAVNHVSASYSQTTQKARLIASRAGAHYAASPIVNKGQRPRFSHAVCGSPEKGKKPRTRVKPFAVVVVLCWVYGCSDNKT